jgi:hypothetical protein
MHNWVNSTPEVILLVLMLIQFVILWLLLFYGMGSNPDQKA